MMGYPLIRAIEPIDCWGSLLTMLPECGVQYGRISSRGVFVRVDTPEAYEWEGRVQRRYRRTYYSVAAVHSVQELTEAQVMERLGLGARSERRLADDLSLEDAKGIGGI